MEGPGRQLLLPTRVPAGAGEEGRLCPQSRDAARAAGRSSGHRGQGPAGSCLPRNLSAINQRGWGCLGGMTLAKLGQSKTRHLSVPWGHSDAGGGGLLKNPRHARASAQVQMLRPMSGCDLRRSHGDLKGGLLLSHIVARPGSTWLGPCDQPDAWSWGPSISLPAPPHPSALRPGVPGIFSPSPVPHPLSNPHLYRAVWPEAECAPL